MPHFLWYAFPQIIPVTRHCGKVHSARRCFFESRFLTANISCGPYFKVDIFLFKLDPVFSLLFIQWWNRQDACLSSKQKRASSDFFYMMKIENWDPYRVAPVSKNLATYTLYTKSRWIFCFPCHYCHCATISIATLFLCCRYKWSNL